MSGGVRRPYSFHVLGRSLSVVSHRPAGRESFQVSRETRANAADSWCTENAGSTTPRGTACTELRSPPTWPDLPRTVGSILFQRGSGQSRVEGDRATRPQGKDSWLAWKSR